MPAGPGRDPVRAMQRLLRILAMLDEAGSTGVRADRLIEIGEYGESDPGTQLALDLRRLRDLGLTIDNVAGKGAPAHYRLISGDNRLRVRLTTEQLAALQRAINVADRADLAKKLGISEASLPAGVGVEVTPSAPPTKLSKCLREQNGKPREAESLRSAAVAFFNKYLLTDEVEEDLRKAARRILRKA